MQQVNIPYMCAVVEDYIYHRKNKRVKVSPRPNDITKLLMAYNMAVNWFKHNNII